MDIEDVDNVQDQTIFANKGHNNNSNSFRVKIGQMQKAIRQNTGYVAKSKNNQGSSGLRKSASIFHNFNRRPLPQTIDNQSTVSEVKSKFCGSSTRSANRIMSAKRQADQFGTEKNDRFNEAVE